MIECTNSRRQLKASSSSNDVDYTGETMKKPNQIIFILVIGFIAVISGCSTPTSTVLPAEAMPAQNPSSLTPYRIQPGDTLDIKFFYNPELNESVTVRPDGYISLQLVNEVSVAGLEPRQVNEMLTERYVEGGGKLRQLAARNCDTGSISDPLSIFLSTPNL
jgi:protein involved in polysaccharide export with SLBB domain